MRLLILTQAVDTEEPVLGFFHSWIKNIADRAALVHVICLKKGTHTLPRNVSVHSLGKETGRSKIKYLFRFFYLIWKFRKEYDVVFVHMNQEYVLLGGIMWRLLGKRIVLWRNHAKGSFLTRIACYLSHVVCYTSPAAYVSTFKHARKMPIGIDTNLFKPGVPKKDSLLFLGRLDPVKRPHLFLAALKRLEEQGTSFSADLYGDPTNPEAVYTREIQEAAKSLRNLAMHGSVPHGETPALYASHDVYVNLTESGSFDKTIGEAMAAGSIVIVANAALKGTIPAHCIVTEDSADAVANAIHYVLTLSEKTQQEMKESNRAYIEQEHSLMLLMNRLAGILSNT